MSEKVKIYQTRRVTIRDIAAKLALSTATVSMALSGKGRISPPVRKQILETAEEMGYVSNRSSCVLGMKETTIGIFLPRTPEEIQGHIKEGIHRACAQNNDLRLTCIVTEYEYGSEISREALKRLARECNGMILMVDEEQAPFYEEGLSLSEERGIPIVSLTHRPSGIAVRKHVAVNGRLAAGNAADLLALCLRHTPTRQVIMLAASPGTSAYTEHYRGFSERCGQCGLSLLQVYDTYDDPQRVPSILEEALRKYPDIKGIYASTHLAAVAADALSQMGLAENISLVGTALTEDNVSALSAPPGGGPLCALMDERQQALAEAAVNALLDMILCKRRDTVYPDTILTPGILLPSASAHKPR